MIFRSTVSMISFFLLLVCSVDFKAYAQDFGAANKDRGELAAFNTPQFAVGDSHRQNLCDRYLAISNGTTKLEDALRGVKLNVVVGAYAGSYFNYNNETGIQPYGGIVVEIMDEVASRAGFTWRDSFGIYDTPSGGENETWTDLLVWSLDNYDLTVDWWAQSLDRINLGAAFLKEWYDSSIILISKKNIAEEFGVDDPGFNLNALFGWSIPFTTNVWLTIIGTVFLSCFVFMLIEWLTNQRKDRKLWAWYTDSMYLSVLNATQTFEYGTPKSAAAKLFGFSSGFFALILTATYTANLASLLVQKPDPDPTAQAITMVTSIEDVTYLKYPVCTWGGTILDSHLEANHASTIRKPKLELLDVYNSLNANECLFAVDTVQGWLEFKAKREYNPFCKLKWVGDDRKVATIGAGFAAKADVGVKCTSLVRNVIDYYMIQLIEEGFVERAWEVDNKRKQDLDCDTFRPDLVSDLSDFGDGSECGSRRLRRSRERRMLEEALQSSEMQRRMKAASNSASSAGALQDDKQGEKMNFDSMIGVFFLHWCLMLFSVVLAAYHKWYKRRKNKIQEQREAHPNTVKMFEKADGIEVASPEAEKNVDGNFNELKQQIRVLNEALAYSNKEQKELQYKIEKLYKVLDNFGEGKKELKEM